MAGVGSVAADDPLSVLASDFPLAADWADCSVVAAGESEADASLRWQENESAATAKTMRAALHFMVGEI